MSKKTTTDWRKEMKRKPFNLDWTFYKENEKSSAKVVTLPHDAMIHEKRSKSFPSGTGSAYFAGGVYYYTKSLHAPKEWEGKHIALEFEGVYQKATILVNDTEVYKNAYGYSNFYVDLSDRLILGADNTITVIADNSNCPNSRWYSGSGIYRNVNLFVAEKSHIQYNSVFADARADGSVRIKGLTTGGDSVKIELKHENNLVKELVTKVTDGSFLAEFQVDSPLLWSDESPDLYGLTIALLTGDKVEDLEELKIGFRTVEWSPQKGLLVNGKRTLLRGSCIHHDNGILGACGYDDAERRKILLHKKAGFNAIRSSHNPCSRAMLEACDELGIYVMDEFVDHWIIHKTRYDYANEDFTVNWKNDLKAMIDKDMSHPSVIMYSIGNEISELGLDSGVSYAKELTDFVKSIDSTRPVTAGINLMLAVMAAKGKGLYGNDKKDISGTDSVPTSAFFNMLMNRMGSLMDGMASRKDADKVTESLEGILDINGYNYATSRYVNEGRKYPKRVIVGSETLPCAAYKNWKLVESLPYLVGDFVWTGMDYLGESGIGTVQYKSDKKDSNHLIISGGAGLIDICGKFRPEISWNRMIWHQTTTPEISVEPMTRAGDIGALSMWRLTDGVSSWTWPGCEGAKNKVHVYSTGEYVELIVNERSYGRKKTKEFMADFKNVKYEPGTITARSFASNGNMIAEKSLSTDTGDTRISAVPEVDELRANGQDLCYINIDLVGDNGITKSSADTLLNIEVSGEGSLIAFGSARPAPKEGFTGNFHTTFLGKAQAIIRSGVNPGAVKVNVTGKGLKAAQLEIKVK